MVSIAETVTSKPVSAFLASISVRRTHVSPVQLFTVVSQQPYPLLFATISGAHLYGFPSPDSDYDLRGVHVLPLPTVVGLDVGQETIEHAQIQDGVELDLVTHDLGGAENSRTVSS
jgi:hypothetical protein